MYVRKKRFVKRKDSSEESINWYTHTIDGNRTKLYRTLGSITLVIALLVSIPVVVFVLRPFQEMVFRVDPSVYDTLVSGKPTVAYVSVEGEVDIGTKPLRVWVFGDLRIYKVRLSTVQEMYGIIHRSGVISVYGEKTLRHSPLYYLDLEEYEEFREKDIDNEFHQAVGPWIGRNVTVAIIDTGIDYTHPDFFDEHNRSIIRALASVLYVWSDTKEYVTWDLEENPNITELLEFDMGIWDEFGEPAFLDINGHGTHVAGIIAGRGWASNGRFKGIAPGVKLVVVKAFDKSGSAGMDACLEALEWVYNNTSKYDIKILSLSWGAAFASDGNDPLSLAVDELVEDKGVWVFVAAGNEGNLPTTVIVPAVARMAFAVGAWDPYYDRIAPFSSLGPTVDLRMKPDLMGAGVMIVSCKSRYVEFDEDYVVDDYYVALSGTSMATPAVAGIAADFIEYFRYWNGRDPTREYFIRWLEDNTRRVNIMGVKDFVSGWGIPIAPHS